MKKELINIAIVDDHQIIIDGIVALLNNHATIKIMFSTTSPLALIDFLKKNNNGIDIVITDILMPNMNGLLLAKTIRQEFPAIKIIALSMNGEGLIVNSLIEDSNISGYILKNTGKTELITAIEKISAGGIHFSEEVLIELTKFRKVKEEEIRLTHREIEIVKLIEKEYSNTKIAKTLFISERTVETHRKNIFRKTQTNNVIGLIKYAYLHNLIQ